MNINIQESKNSPGLLTIRNGADIKFAHYNTQTGKVSILKNPIARQIVKLNGEDYVKKAIEIQVNNWRYETSPLRKLTQKQVEKLLNDMKAINTLSVCFQDYITSLSVLNELDQFSEVTTDLQQLKDNILSFTKKVSAVIGVDNTIDIADKADKINEILNEVPQSNEQTN